MESTKTDSDGTSDSLRGPLPDEDYLERRLVWDVSAIGVFVTRFAVLFGGRMGVTGSQWLTLKAVDFLTEGEGATVRDIAALLNVNGSFISAQSKLLQQQGMLRRSQSVEDGRVIILSLTDAAKEQLANAESGTMTLEKVLRGDLESQSIQELSDTLNAMRRRIGRAIRLIDAGD